MAGAYRCVRTTFCPVEPPLRSGERILGSVVGLGLMAEWMIGRAVVRRTTRRCHNGRLRKARR